MKHRPLGSSARTDIEIPLGFRLAYGLGDAANNYGRSVAETVLGQRVRRS